MTALSSLVRIPKIPRRQRAAVTVALGLSAGAVGWSELASAKGQQLQTLILPDHYQRLSDGSLVVSSWTGEQLVLSRDQFLELEGGLMLVVDDLAIGAIRQLPLVGTLETHLISDAFPVRSSDGTIIGTQTSSLLRSGEGTAPRLFEEVDIQRYELAQDLSDSSPTMVSAAAAAAAAAGVGASGAGGGLLLGLALAGSGTTVADTTGTSEAPENQVPVFASSTASTSVIENTSGTVYTASASAPDTGVTVTFSLDPSSADVAAFSITANGALSFQSAPDYESPTDDGTDNAYVVGIVAEDGNGGTATQTLTVTVTDAVTPGTGFVINGINAVDYSGRSVSSAGDINGDGIDDLIIGAPYADPYEDSNAGETYVVFGKDTAVDGAFAATLELSDLDVGNGFVLEGIDDDDLSGHSVSSAGDINGDGIDDLIIGAYEADPNGNNGAGESYVVFGKDTAFNATLELSSLTGSNGFVIEGIDAGDRSGVSVSSAGDINGDGINDLIIGAYRADPNGDDGAGESYVVFGKDTAVDGAFAGTLELSSLTGSNGFVIEGIDAGDRSGVSVSSAGDINGDGINDLIIGAYRADPNGDDGAGESYVVFGKGTSVVEFGAELELADLNGSNGFVIEGINDSDFSGGSVSSAGDINGDGIDDLIIGAREADPNGNNNAGQSYVVFGKDTAVDGAFEATFELSDLDGSDGFVIEGINDSDFSGGSVSSAGDINGDGIDDLIIGAREADPNGNNNAGQSYVVFGKDTAVDGAFEATFELSDLDGSDGFVLNGIDAFDYSGGSVSSAGDINGDGIDDLIIGAPDADPNGNNYAGQSYVVFGTTEAWSASIDLDIL